MNIFVDWWKWGGKKELDILNINFKKSIIANLLLRVNNSEFLLIYSWLFKTLLPASNGVLNLLDIAWIYIYIYTHTHIHTHTHTHFICRFWNAPQNSFQLFLPSLLFVCYIFSKLPWSGSMNEWLLRQYLAFLDHREIWIMCGWWVGFL